MMLAKFVTPGFLKIKVNRNKGYDVLIFYMTSPKILSRDQSLVNSTFL